MASRRLIISYAIDWLVIIGATVISLLLSTVNPDFHTFGVLDMDLSYPYQAPKLSLPLFILISIVFPILAIIAISLFQPRHSTHQNPILSHTLSQKLRSLNASLLGLGVSLATSTVFFTGVKNLSGKPRPNFLSICHPDLENIDKYVVGGVGAEFSKFWVMVNVDICKQSDEEALKDAFRSFPSGYATIAFAGLWYLSLFLCHSFSIFPSSSSHNFPHSSDFDAHEDIAPLLSNDSEPSSQSPEELSAEITPFPAFMLLVPYVPLGLAIFIAGTRYFDFRNHGSDVLAGAGVGSVTAYIGFRIYHPSLMG